MPADCATAWVESPLQALCAVEYAYANGCDLRIVPRAGAAQLPATVARLAELGLPDGVRIDPPRGLPTLGSAHWVIGDAFSGMARSAIALRMPHRLTILDDGAASLGIPAVLSGSRLGRSTDTAAMLALAERAASRLRDLAALGALELFSYYPLEHSAHRPNRFAWLRSRGLASEVRGRVVLGSAAVVDGLMPLGAYLDWLKAIDRPFRFFPHRRESAAVLDRIEAAGVAVESPAVPIELVVAGARDIEVLSLPSSAVESLRIILDGSGSSVEVRGSLVRT